MYFRIYTIFETLQFTR